VQIGQTAFWVRSLDSAKSVGFIAAEPLYHFTANESFFSHFDRHQKVLLSGPEKPHCTERPTNNWTPHGPATTAFWHRANQGCQITVLFIVKVA
jgi:hypothetical protein